MPYEAMSAETVNIRGHEEDMIDAYMARPAGPGPHPGVVIIHHMPGWDEATKEIARKFAHHGYVAISPNLHFREGKGSPEENSASIRAAGGMPDERTMGDVEGAIAYLRTLPYLNGKVGIIGYCSGGRQVYLAACTLTGIDAAIDC
jgi:carboxymethylenebutenolidase